MHDERFQTWLNSFYFDTTCLHEKLAENSKKSLISHFSQIYSSIYTNGIFWLAFLVMCCCTQRLTRLKTSIWHVMNTHNSCQRWIRKPQTQTIYYRSHMWVYKRRCLEIPFRKAFRTKYLWIFVYIIRIFLFLLFRLKIVIVSIFETIIFGMLIWTLAYHIRYLITN